MECCLRCLVLIGSLIAHAGALRNLPITSVKVDRRSAAAGVAALVFTPRLTLADTCLGKCPEDPEKKAQRLAIQQGLGSKPPPSLALLIAETIEQKEKTIGMSLSEDEKKELEAKVRQAYPGVK